MPVWGWVVLGVAVIVVVVLAGLLVAANRRTAALRRRFGPEYDRTVAATGDKRDAETNLEERQDRRSQLPIRALTPMARERYQRDWRTVQSQFVDDPTGAVAGADRLLQLVMRERGYPVEDFDQRAEDLSVDHPDVVQNYRQGHRLATGTDRHEETSTEDLRQAMWHYRALFEELVEPTETSGGPTETSGGPTDSQQFEDRSVR
jgi:hypothetical protein